MHVLQLWLRARTLLDVKLRHMFALSWSCNAVASINCRLQPLESGTFLTSLSDCETKMAHVIPAGHASHKVDINREVINRLQDFLNNPDTKYSPLEIWHKDYIELRPWPFQTGTGREGISSSSSIFFISFVSRFVSHFLSIHLCSNI
jgi:hypothetical protein